MTIENATASAAAAAGQTQNGEAVKNPNGELGQNDFLKLMIAQLQAQNPLEPGNANEYVNELATFTQVEQTTNLANASELSSAVGLIGRTVSYNNARGEVVAGAVQSVQSTAAGTTVTIGGVGGVKLASITEVG
ncbi:MAG TPA: flagellar hook capping FlgD N-terminal domain-containing protein [Solirubrobacteraceae bacterium]|jgi:flagellar basal-body rod modification protein FlgD|nr:flagellar hook capping FlgD N-terminal domain-containing protein [Solirubrobacteraceae bacterium]